MIAMRQGAAAQIELADAAIAMIETVAKYADETALAALSAGAARTRRVSGDVLRLRPDASARLRHHGL
jgi:hypothetical protein